MKSLCAIALLLLMVIPIGCWRARQIPVPPPHGLVAQAETAGDAPASGKEGLPNIVIVVLDTVRFDFLSLADHSLDTSPNLLKIAENGFLFNHTYATFDNTPGSHFSIFTGFLAGRNEAHDVVENSLPYHLKKMGYSSLGISANLVVRPQTMRSVKAFDSFISPVWHYFTNVDKFEGNKRWFSAKYLNGLPEAEKSRLLGRLKSTRDRYNAPNNEFSASLIVSAAEDVNMALETELPKLKKPGLLFLNYIDAHDPYYPSPEFYDVENEPYLDVFYSDLRTRSLPDWMVYPREKIKDKKKRSELLNRVGMTFGGLKWCLSDDLTKEQIDRYKARYRGEIKYLDYHIGQLIDILKKNGYYDNTVIIITADHGESFGEKNLMTHWFNNKGDRESTRHVPLIILPENKRLKAGILVEDETSIADIAPTIYDILGADFHPFSEQFNGNLGKSLLGKMSGYYNKRSSNYKVTPTVPTPKAETPQAAPAPPAPAQSASPGDGTPATEGNKPASDKTKLPDPATGSETTGPAASNPKDRAAKKVEQKKIAPKKQAPDEMDDEMTQSLKALGYIAE